MSDAFPLSQELEKILDDLVLEPSSDQPSVGAAMEGKLFFPFKQV